MELGLKDKLFIVTGATSGFGRAIAKALMLEGANLILNARGEEKLKEFQERHPKIIEILPGDITTDYTISKLIRLLKGRYLDGVVINAGGPPAASFLRAPMSEWDKAYANV